MNVILNLGVLLLIPLSVISQENYTFDITEDAEYVFSVLGEGYSIGNHIDESYYEFIYNGDLDVNHQTIEILNATLHVYGDIINSGDIILKYDYISEIIEHGGQLNIEDVEVHAYKMYPNPAINKIMVSGDVSSLEMFDLNGREVASSKSNSIDFNVKSGIYLIKIEHNNNVTIKKLIVK